MKRLNEIKEILRSLHEEIKVTEVPTIFPELGGDSNSGERVFML